MRAATLALIALLALPCGAAEFDLSPEHQAIDFLVGHWATTSLFPGSGVEAPGDLAYEWVLGGAWLRITFFGRHPERPIWEAHGLMRWNADADNYQSVVFFGAEEPTTMSGELIDGRTLRISYPDGKGGIDYTPTDEGAVYQENWAIDPATGERRIVLETDYAPVD